jgi:signal peptidase I
MAPELSPGVTVFVDNTAFWARDPLRGEVVWMDSPEGRLFRRVLAIPGDKVAVESGRATVNGIGVDEPYATGHGPVGETTLLPPDTYYVLADDREAADSRAWGPIPRDDIFGAAAFTRRAGGDFEPIRRAPMPDPLSP